MNKRWLEILFVLFLALGIPMIFMRMFYVPQSEIVNETTSTQTQVDFKYNEETQPSQNYEISVLIDESIQKLELEDYIVGVVLQEMPAEFELEALKAQAVVARTYTMRRQAIGNKHQGASVCANASCCQGYCDKDMYISKGGTQEEIDKITQAVVETAGEVLIYDGELIDATYFSCSGGATEDAAAVWGADVPYLRSTQSPGEESASHYTDTVSYTTDKLSELLGITLSSGIKDLVSDITYTNGGGIESIRIGGKKFTGIEVRKLLNLRSTAFSISIVGNIITITTRGYGHRVGMSQYGADAMAIKGSTYAEILAHYYHGTTLTGY